MSDTLTSEQRASNVVAFPETSYTVVNREHYEKLEARYLADKKDPQS